jgi:hypothetical protein
VFVGSMTSFLISLTGESFMKAECSTFIMDTDDLGSMSLISLG